MTSMTCVRPIMWASVIAAIALVGCRGTTPPVAFYTLHSPATMKMESGAAGQEISIGVGPVAMPDFLDRPQIVTRTSANRISVSEFHRWAGSLPEDFLRVLAENLSILLATNSVAAYPWEGRFDPTYRVLLDVKQFDGQLGEDVLLNVTWTVVAGTAKEELLVQSSTIREPVSAPGYEALVSAQSEAIATLSREIVEAIRTLQARR